MNLKSRNIPVKMVPEKLDSRSARAFLREAEGAMSGPRPALVLDCSRVHNMDSETMHLLLCCLEAAMKHNGDVRLAGVQPKARLNMEFAAVDRLFMIFDSAHEAVESFHNRRLSVHRSAHQFEQVPQENAA